MKLSKLLRALLFGLNFRMGVVEDGVGGDSSEISGADVVGTGNDARLAMLAGIADQNDESRADELADVNDDGTTQPFTAEGKDGTENTGTENTESTTDSASTEADADPEITRKVNGKEVTKKLSEWLDTASKVEAADEYLRTAKEALRQPEPPAAPPPGPTEEELQRQQDEEDRALVRAIQVGTEEEAAAALRKLRQDRSSPSLSRDDVARTIDERLTFKEAMASFQSEYADVWGDPVLQEMAINRDRNLIQQGDKRSYAERFKAVGAEIRSWRENLVKSATPAPAPVDPLAQKEARKANAPAAPRAASAKTQQEQQEQEVDDSPSAVIAAMAARRGGPQWMQPRS